ncbi:2-isopropylmalate synthase [Thiospirochaeta perfilievii]|uniref:2-isopropylmalate synthase n=1 Tax=Thiospirochaeta perfilievii TaxID=252967 RepID=A0A5C1Q989_9SPIO|nr:2-isopropylmalate synthase [Thiospirochaeta perfilievii]QEN03630.1 2-isopropylmalate synthase [Thiospirochaeta perfilievii]
MDYTKYKQYPPVKLDNREWPSKKLDRAPLWCSVDLRDGNQSLPIPMSINEKVEFFNLLVEMGFKEIEVGFPSASETEFNFLRKLVDDNLIPDDVHIQILTQSRDHLIKRSFEALEGVKNAIVHFYNSTSTLQRKVVFKKSKDEIKEIAVSGAKLIKEMSKNFSGNIRYEYSPESFTGTELDYAKDICEAVMDVIKPTPTNKLILNLPGTVEMSTANVHADQIEWFCKNIKDRDSVIISLHAHNDRGTATAATELGLLAGADRVEGTLFGNGERTGNVDIINLGMNFYTQGIDPKLDFSNIDKIVEIYSRCTRMTVGPRHPWAGNLVYTAFSGSHQDAIKKGLEAHNNSDSHIWEVPYLPIDPSDLNRVYEEIIRINSQSGKGGVAFVLENSYGYKLPKSMHPEFSQIIQKITDKTGNELSPEYIFSTFNSEYLEVDGPYRLLDYTINTSSLETKISAKLEYKTDKIDISSFGNGPIDAFFNAVKKVISSDIKFHDYSEHSLTEGADSKAVAYIGMEVKGQIIFGVGIDSSINTASIKALLCALNRVE